MRLSSAALAMAVLLAAAPLSHAQLGFWPGGVSLYGARVSYGAPYLGTPFYGASPYAAYGYGYGAYSYGAGLTGYRFGVLPRHARLLRSMWIFAPPTTTTTKPSSPTTIDGSTINVRLVDKGPDWSKQKTEAENWKYDLLGIPRKPVTPSDKGFAEKVKNRTADLSADDRAALATASDETAKRLRNNESKLVQDVFATIFFAEAKTASVKAREVVKALVTDFYTEQSWNPGDSLDAADRRSTFAKFFENLAQALKQ